MTRHPKRLAQNIYLNENDQLVTILSILDAIPDLAFLLTKEGQYLDIFGANESLLVADSSALLGKFIKDVLPEAKSPLILDIIEKTITTQQLQVCEYELETKIGPKTFEGRVTPLKLDQGQELVIWFARDITDQKQREITMAHMAYHDPLTGIANRTGLLARLEEETSRCLRHNAFSTLVFIDLNDFKLVNDKYGHQVGDEVLVQVAVRLKAQTRDHDFVCRLGGDEFILVISMIGESIADAMDKSVNLASKLRQTLAAPILIEEHIIKVGVSVGISVIPQEGKNAHTILKEADSAMYINKLNDKGLITTLSKH